MMWDRCQFCGKPEGSCWYRAGGGVWCSICGKLYYDHPMDRVHVAYDGSLWLTKLCNGDLVKL